mmetsp:Transcript_21225/g.59768  ORF Transcript_21225/g.59768 Transcript_21225/m.59768 type:complete len:345 (-) Transcript_21225:342-1376(-)
MAAALMACMLALAPGPPLRALSDKRGSASPPSNENTLVDAKGASEAFPAASPRAFSHAVGGSPSKSYFRDLPGASSPFLGAPKDRGAEVDTGAGFPTSPTGPPNVNGEALACPGSPAPGSGARAPPNLKAGVPAVGAEALGAPKRNPWVDFSFSISSTAAFAAASAWARFFSTKSLGSGLYAGGGGASPARATSCSFARPAAASGAAAFDWAAREARGSSALPTALDAGVEGLEMEMGGDLCVLAAAFAMAADRSSLLTGVGEGGGPDSWPNESRVIRILRAVAVVSLDAPRVPEPGLRPPPEGSSMGLPGITAGDAAGCTDAALAPSALSGLRALLAEAESPP